jgi:hypothetical protein
MREKKILFVADALHELITSNPDITIEEVGAGFARAIFNQGHAEGYGQKEEELAGAGKK